MFFKRQRPNFKLAEDNGIIETKRFEPIRDKLIIDTRRNDTKRDEINLRTHLSIVILTSHFNHCTLQKDCFLTVVKNCAQSK